MPHLTHKLPLETFDQLTSDHHLKIDIDEFIGRKEIEAEEKSAFSNLFR